MPLFTFFISSEALRSIHIFLTISFVERFVCKISVNTKSWFRHVTVIQKTKLHVIVIIYRSSYLVLDCRFFERRTVRITPQPMDSKVLSSIGLILFLKHVGQINTPNSDCDNATPVDIAKPEQRTF